MIEIRNLPLTEDIKNKIYQGFSKHVKALIGHDEKFDAVAFVATDDGRFVGAIVVELFWGAFFHFIKYKRSRP
jgi:predicted N-acetyltransferase YhbS